MTEKPVLYLLPGLLCDATVWEPQVAALSDIVEPRVATYADKRSLAAMADAVLADAPERFAVAGHSMGGRVAFEVFRKAKERITGLALLDTSAEGPKPMERENRMPLVERAKAEGMEVVVREWLPPMVHPHRVKDAALMDPLAAMIKRVSPDQFEGQIEALLNRPDATPLLSEIHCPVLVLCGRQDAWRTVADHEELAAMLPTSTLEIIEDCGHMATVERPDAVNTCLRAWLDRIA